MSDAIRDVQRYAAFQRGWDGYDAEPISQDTIRRAVSVIELLSALGATDIDPSPISDGRIDVEGTVRGYSILVTVPCDGLELFSYRLADDLVRALGAAAESRSDLVSACVALIAPLRRHAADGIRDLVLEVTAEVDLVAGLALAIELAEDPSPTVREAAASVLARLDSIQPGELTHVAEAEETTRVRARVRSVDRSTVYEGPALDSVGEEGKTAALSTCEDCPLRGPR